MSARFYFLLPLFALLLGLAGLTSACVKTDPADTAIVEKVQQELAANHDPAIMTRTKKWEIFKNTIKIWVTDDFEQDKVKPLAEAAAKAFGPIARTNGKIEPTYIIQLYQRQKNQTTGETKEYNIAKATFYNGKETVTVDMFGQGDGKYDY